MKKGHVHMQFLLHMQWQTIHSCWMDRISALRTVGTVLMSGEYKTVICFMRSSEGSKFKLSNSLTLPPTDVLVTK